MASQGNLDDIIWVVSHQELSANDAIEEISVSKVAVQQKMFISLLISIPLGTCEKARPVIGNKYF